MAKFYASTSSEVEEREIKHSSLSRSLAGECVVLLENDGALPLKEAGKIALYGSGVRHTVKGGTGSGDVNSRSVVTIEQGFKNAGFEIVTGAWLDREDVLLAASRKKYDEWVHEEVKKPNKTEIGVTFDNPYKEPAPCAVEEADIHADEAKYAVYVISRNSGEGADRFCEKGDYLLYDEEALAIEKIAAAYERTIVVLNIGGVMDLTALKNIHGIGAILLMSQLGNIGGDVLLDIVTGKVTPSGKTTDTWARDYRDYPSSAAFSHNNGNVHDEYYTDGVYMGYRYFDTFGKDCEYCFGFGRSYTSFAIETKSLEVIKDIIKLTVNVRNTGAEYSGKEVVQVYVSAPAGKIDKPLKTLVAFKKTQLLAPGEDEDIGLSFSLKSAASYCTEKAEWLLEGGDYLVLVGNSSTSASVAAVVTLDADTVTRKVRNLFPLDCELKEIRPGRRPVLGVPGTALKAAVSRADIVPEEVRYVDVHKELKTEKHGSLTLKDVIAGRCTVEDLVAELSVEELAELCVGTLRATGGLAGNASYTVPGAAGDTHAIEERGIKGLVLADGPAGLRLAPHFKVTKDGKVVVGGQGLGGAEANENFPADLDPATTKDYYQYCTAIPIGWALAQSWNEELVTDVGKMIGYEMEQFNVDLWLAPAMNIHRNPLCGRNFEYYSEDPLIAGRFAAAMTLGVQTHKGKGTTIKHFAVNNQEDNRYFVNEHVSERALREIYLKGFEIAVKEASPLSIMTSYNLLNGIHTACNKDLIQHMARDEWGFKGFVMTDWFASQNVPTFTGKFVPQYPISASTGCVQAGNDTQMPGCQKNVDDIVEAVKTGREIDGFKVTLGDLQFCAANVLRVVAECTAN